MENTALIQTTGAPIEAARISGPELWLSHLAAEVAAGQIADATSATYRRGFAKFATWAKGANLERTPQAAIKQWLADLRAAGHSQNAISVWFAGVRAFFAWALSEGHIPADPTAAIKRGKRAGTARAHKREMLTDDEMIRVLTLPLSPRDRALVHLLAYTGARGVELHRADIDDLKTDGQEMVLHVQGKGRTEKDERVVIAHQDAKDAVRDLLAERGERIGPLFASESNRSEGERLSPRALRMIVRNILDRAGITSPNKTTHSFRHSAITAAIRGGATLQDAQAMARHANVATTQVYFHNLSRLENAAEKKISYGR